MIKVDEELMEKSLENELLPEETVEAVNELLSEIFVYRRVIADGKTYHIVGEQDRCLAFLDGMKAVSSSFDVVWSDYYTLETGLREALVAASAGHCIRVFSSGQALTTKFYSVYMNTNAHSYHLKYFDSVGEAECLFSDKTYHELMRFETLEEVLFVLGDCKFTGEIGEAHNVIKIGRE